METDKGQVLLDLHGTDWDATAGFPAAGQVSLSRRRYRGGAAAQVTLDMTRMRYDLIPGSGGEAAASAGPLSELRGLLARL